MVSYRGLSRQRKKNKTSLEGDPIYINFGGCHMLPEKSEAIGDL